MRTKKSNADSGKSYSDLKRENKRFSIKAVLDGTWVPEKDKEKEERIAKLREEYIAKMASMPDDQPLVTHQQFTPIEVRIESKPKYSDLLRDPRWQRKRLEIMQRDNFSCKGCGSSYKTLNVHHRIYRKGLNPWEYKDSDLITLCEGCHAKQHKSKTTKNYNG